MHVFITLITSKPIKLYTLVMCSFLHTNYTSVRLGVGVGVGVPLAQTVTGSAGKLMS